MNMDDRSTQRARWMADAQQGDRVAYAALLDDVGPMVQQFVRRRVRDVEEAKDVYQDVLLALHRARHAYEPVIPRPNVLSAPKNRIVSTVAEYPGSWLDWAARRGLTYGCPLQAAAVEFDDQPGPVRDVVLEHFARLDRELHRAVEFAVTERHFRHDLDVGQFVFEMMGMIFAYHHSARMLKAAEAESRARAAFERLVAAASPAV